MSFLNGALAVVVLALAAAAPVISSGNVLRFTGRPTPLRGTPSSPLSILDNCWSSSVRKPCDSETFWRVPWSVAADAACFKVMSASGITRSARRKNASASGDKSNTVSARLIRPRRFSAVMGAPVFSERGCSLNSLPPARVRVGLASSAGTTSSAVGNVPFSKGIPCKRCCN